MNKGFWHGIAGVVAVAVIGVAVWQFISLHERVHTLEEEMNVLLAQTQVINSQLAEINASSDKPEESTSETVDMTGFQEALNGIGNFEQGTAGSSLKAYIVAAGLLDWLHDVGTLPIQEMEEQSYHCLLYTSGPGQQLRAPGYGGLRGGGEDRLLCLHARSGVCQRLFPFHLPELRRGKRGTDSTGHQKRLWDFPRLLRGYLGFGVYSGEISDDDFYQSRKH